MAENSPDPQRERVVGRNKSHTTARKSAAPCCDRCGSTRSEQMIRAAHIALYKCVDCGWRFGHGNQG
jgi:hypothetical protein